MTDLIWFNLICTSNIFKKLSIITSLCVEVIKSAILLNVYKVAKPGNIKHISGLRFYKRLIILLILITKLLFFFLSHYIVSLIKRSVTGSRNQQEFWEVFFWFPIVTWNYTVFCSHYRQQWEVYFKMDFSFFVAALMIHKFF